MVQSIKVILSARVQSLRVAKLPTCTPENGEMGKVRAKKRSDRRLRPTGLPSVREAEEEQDLEGPSGSDQNPTSAPLMEKVQNA